MVHLICDGKTRIPKEISLASLDFEPVQIKSRKL